MAVTEKLTRLDMAIERGTQRLLELQRPDGVWVGELESNVTMTAQHLFWHHYLGLRTPELDRRIANELMARMRDDGTWSIWFEGPPDLSTSIEAYVACRLAGVDPGKQALAFIQRQGGIPKARLFTKCFMALIGQWPWQKIAPIPPELVLLPRNWPLSVYDFSCWARQTFVALALSQSLRPVRPSDVDLRAIGALPGQTRPPRRPWALRRKAQATAEQWIRERQEADGSWGGIQPPWVWSIIGLAALGNGLDDPTVAKAIEGWNGFLVEEGERSAARGVPVAGLGYRARGARSARVRRLGRPPGARQGRRLSPARGSHGQGRLVDPQARPRAGRLGVRVRERPLSRCRRHRRRRAHAPRARHRRRRDRPRHRLARGDAVARRRLGRVRRRQQRDVALQDPVLRLRQGHRRADRRRDRALSRGCSARSARTATPPTAVSTGSSPSRRTTARGSAAGASTTSTARAPRCPALEAMGSSTRPPGDAPRGRVARLRPAGERRLRRGHPLVRRSRLARPRRFHYRLANGMGIDRRMWPQETLRLPGRAGRQTISVPRSVPTAIGTSSISPAQDFRSIS